MTRWRWFVNATVHLRFADCCEQQTDAFHAMGLFPMSTNLALGETDAPAANPALKRSGGRGGGGEGGMATESSLLDESSYLGMIVPPQLHEEAPGDGSSSSSVEREPRNDGASLVMDMEHQKQHGRHHHRHRAPKPGDRPTRRATLFGSVVGIYRSGM